MVGLLFLWWLTIILSIVSLGVCSVLQYKKKNMPQMSDNLLLIMFLTCFVPVFNALIIGIGIVIVIRYYLEE